MELDSVQGAAAFERVAVDEGDTVCSALVGISSQIQVQNKILVKILAQLQSLKTN